MNDPLWYLREAEYAPDPMPEPPGSRITFVIYRVDANGVTVLKPLEEHRGFTHSWFRPEPPCACQIACPLKGSH